MESDMVTAVVSTCTSLSRVEYILCCSRPQGTCARKVRFGPFNNKLGGFNLSLL